MFDFVGTGNQLTRDEIIEKAVKLRVQPAVFLAVVDIEAAGEGYLSKTDFRMKALFEAHVFSRFTNHRYDASHPNISSRSWNRSLYKGGAREYDRIAEAANLDETAALRAVSWGLGQVLGMNYQMLDFRTPQEMVENFKQSEDNQFDGMIKFCEKSGALSRLQRAIPDFVGFTRIYNGTGQVTLYSGRLRGAYLKALQDFKTPTPTPRTGDPQAWTGVLVKGLHNDARVTEVQTALRDLGFYKVPPFKLDGDFGTGTEWAVMQFQSAQRLVRDGVVGPATREALGLH